ncbi:MAG: cation:proton antiporter, partial [Acidobacteria bacterium]|nr:cation:proton antiporter [Acidobacteriota bacterium]
LVAAYWLGLPMLLGLTLGAIVSGTSSGEVIPMVGKLRLQPVSRVTLLLEATFTDVLCIVFTLGFLEAMRFHEIRPGLMLGHMLSSFLMAGVTGVAGAIVWSATLSKVRGLQNSIFTTPAFVFVLFGITELLGFSGAIAALGFGIALGNIESVRGVIQKFVKGVHPVRLNDVERSFFAEIVFVMKTFFFVYIGLSIQLGQWGLVFAGLALTLAAFLLRIPVVRITMQKTTPQLDAALMAVLIPKGLAAAALASLPVQQGIAGGEVVRSVAYAMILFTIVISAALSFLVEQRGVVPPYRLFFAGYAPMENPVKPSGS